jgi:hypothetical protein
MCPYPWCGFSDCASLSSQSWEIKTQDGHRSLEVAVGDRSWEVFVQASLVNQPDMWITWWPQCESALTSVTWATDNPAVATVERKATSVSWADLNPVAPGLTVVTAQIKFRDGKTQNGLPLPIHVVPR